MNSCLVPNSDAFIDEIVQLCDSAVNLDLREAHTTLHNGIKTMIERARSSAEPESQLKMLRDTLDELYASDDEYSNFFSELMPPGHVHVMFNTNYGQASDDKQPSQTGEAAKSRRITRSRNFLDSKFKGAPNAKLYFRRSIRNDMVETFLVKRSSGTPRYFTSQEEMNLNVKTYKQELLDRVFAFFDSDKHLKDRVKNLPRTFYDAQGNYTGVIEAIKAVIDSRLAPEMFEQSGVLPLDEFYRNYRGTDKSKRDRAKLMLDAYNGWVMLQNFDTIVSDVFGSIVKISPDDFNGHDADLHKYKIADRATNMWNNWGDTDDIADMADVISDVTQSLVETSRMYKWRSGEAYPDRYLSFNDFNFAVGWVKRLAFDPISDTIDLHDTTKIANLDKLSLDTKRILFDILNWNKENGNYKRDANGNVLLNADGSISKIPREVTLKQLIARVNENPQKYLHAIFDVLTTTNILDKFNAGEYAKNIIWSLHKEIFGITKSSENNPRSLYNIHAKSESDSVYQILTQVAASTFPEDYLQYYEKSDGVISTRLLQDYAIDSVKRALFQDIQQTSLALSPDMYARFGIIPIVFKDNPEFLGELHVNVTLPSGFNYTIRTTPNEVYKDNLTPEQAKSIWESKQFQRTIKDILGIDFESDPDLKNAYIEVVGGTSNAVIDISNLLGRVLFSAVVNNDFTPRYKRASKNRRDLEEFLKKQYGDSDYGKYLSGVRDATGYIPILPTNLKDAALGSIAMATAMNNSLLSAAQSKTGEGTSLANYVLSRMRNFYPNQIEMQCKKMNSATKDLSFVVNSNNLFEGILTRRELKTLSTNQQSTQFSDSQSFQLSFIDDFIAAFIPDPDNNAYIKDGRVSFLPTVNSDKSQIDGLLVNLHAKTRIPDGRGGFKTYMELTDSEIEQEMVSEFKPMYDRIISNINNELSKIGTAIASYNQWLIENGKAPLETQLVDFYDSDSVVTKNQALLNLINNTFKDREDLGKKPKERIINGLHQVITHYNQTHRRNPIMLSEHVHYVFDAETGLLTSNKTLESLWGRFNPDTDIATKTKLAQLYAKEVGYQAYMKRNGLSDPSSVTSFFKYKEHLTVENLIKMGFKIPLWGSNAVVRHDQSEIQFLRGDAKFTAEQLKDPHYQQLAALSQDLGRNWVSRDGLMIIAKGYIDGVLTNITTLEQLNKANNLVIHPMLSKLNRLDYLCTQQYTISTVGSHYVHKGKGKPGQILVEEANRWLASNKRNVAATSTVHLFQNKQLDGVPSVYNVGIIDDVFFDLYSAMGDLYLEGHAPLDGGMFVNAWIPDLENNSLAGEAAGLDKKQFGTFYSELYGAGGIVKTAGFAATNARMRRQKAWVNLQRNMSSFKWIKENADENGNDIPEIIDITKNYLGNDIDYKQAIKGEKILYKRPAHDNPSEMAAYEQLGIKSLGNNTYEISEIEINSSGVPIGAVQKRIEVIDNNWDLFTKVFGGQYSLELGPNGKLKWSENSNKLMVHAINNIGYRKDNSKTLSEDFGQLGESEAIEKHMNSVKTGLDQDDIWQPLKYSDLHYIPNIGAIKSLQFNVNPNGEAVLESYVPMNFMVMRLAQLGIQLDKEHHADMSEVSMPTQIIQACANRSFTSEYAREIYTALETLTRQATQPFLDGIKDIITSDDPTKLSEEVTKLIIDNLLHQNGDDNSVNAILKQILEKAERGETIKFAEDVKGKLPWSDPTISNKLFSSLSTTLTNIAVKMKFPGSLSVICPTERVEKIYGNSLLDSFTRVTNPDGSTRTKSPEDALKDYQQRVIAGEEVDASGNNMLVYDFGRDVTVNPPQNPGESVEQYQARIKQLSRRQKLSAVAKLKPQHNYVIEYTDGSTEKFTFNTPIDYRGLKNIVCFGKKGTSDLLPPINYDQLLEEKIRQVRADGIDPRVEVLYSYFKTPRLLQSSVMSETGMGKEEVKRLFGIFLSKEKGGLTTRELAELIYADHADIFEDDTEIHDLLLDALLSARTKGDLTQYENRVIESEAKKLADAEYSEYAALLYANTNMTPEEYESYYRIHNPNKQVARIYENVEEGRALGAYNARFQDEYGNYFNMFDLDSMVLLFDLNGLWTDRNRPIRGYKLFQDLTLEEQQEILNKVFVSTAFDKEGVYNYLIKKYNTLPAFDKNFMSELIRMHGDNAINIITDLHKVAKVSAHKILQNDLFKLSDNYTGTDRRIYANRTLIKPTNIEVDAYETILPQIYQTVFGLQEGDIVEDIIKDKDFFIKRGLDRFACKLDHSDYDYELKNFNGEHVYIVDRSHGVPNHLQGLPIFTETRNGKHYRLDSNGNVLYEMASEHDDVCKVGNVQVIVTDNPMFYINSMNYNTLKVSPKRVTQESYDSLVENLKDSKRTNSQNFMKAITIGEGSVMDLKTFKEFNTAIDNITYETVKKTEGGKDFKSVAQICNILLKNGRELHVSFEQSLEMVAGRIPAQSQQSFMIQRVIGFDSSGLNTAMVSTFQLFLQGSDLDIDAVTMLGYEFDHNGKFVGWSPYFKIDTKEKLKASKKMPLPTGQKTTVNVSQKAPNNFFEIYDKYFGTLFQTIKLPTGEDKFKTKDGVLELQMVYDTPEGLELLAQFLRDFNEYGVNIQGEMVESESGVLIKTDSENFFKRTDAAGNVVGEWNLFKHRTAGGAIGARPDQVYAMAEQILKFANDHNDYLNTAKEHLKDKMAKNYVVHYIYKVAEALCNQTEAQVGLDISTKDVKGAAGRSAMANASNSYAPGGAEVKHKSVGEGQVGKSCVGIGAVGIKANSTTQFYISEILNYGSDWDREKIMFKRPITIGGVTYSGFANMHTSKQFSERDMANVQAALEYINALEHPDQLTPDVAVNIASLLSIAVDNAKDLALAKINSGPKMMGLYAYGLTLGIPINDLVDIINSEEGRILTELTEGSYFNNDTTAFKVLDAIKKLDGNVMGDLDKYSYVSRDARGKVVKVSTTIAIDGKVRDVASTHEALFTLMYEAYTRWFNSVKEQPWFKKSVSKNPVLATSFSGMLRHLLLGNAFKDVFNSSKYLIEGFINKHITPSAKTSDATNWIASLYQMVSYLEDMQTKISKFKSSKGRDLRKLAQGAEEMRILGSILSINKGLKATASEAEAFIDTIENLIYDRKKVLGMKVSEDDRLDFIRFMTDEEYQKQKIDEYERVKHSVNILHLISKVPHFNGYLKTQMIPSAFFMTSSIKFRTIHKLRRNVVTENSIHSDTLSIPLFNLFEVNGNSEKENILRGLEDLIHYKLFTRWAYDQKLQFKVPAGFAYFTKRNQLVSNPNGETVINLWTQHGMATFKKYMEEVYIPMLKDSSISDNPFISSLRKISYDKTPVHNSVTAYSLPGDLMSKKGSQGEINAHTFASFQNLGNIIFQEDSKIYSLHDAFYIYAQYCYMGRKGQKSLMSLFDNDASRKGLAKSFTEHIAQMDVDGNITCSESELIAWCAPYGTQHLNSKYGYVTSREEFGVSLKQKREDPSRIKEDPDNPSDVDPSDVESISVEDVGGYVSAKKPENFRTYQEQYLSSQYDRQTLNHFLVPVSEGEGSYTTFYPDANIAGITTDIDLTINHDMIQGIVFEEEFVNAFEAKIADGTITKFTSFEEFKKTVIDLLKPLHIPYKVALYANSKREINFGILQSLINNLINC